MKYFKKLLGEHIYLSPVSEQDAEKYTEWMNDFETTDYIGQSTQIYTVEKETRFLDKCSEDKNEVTLGIVNLKTDKLIGNCGLKDINIISRTATLGIFIGEKEERSKGYGAEAIKLLLDFGFNYLNLHEIKLDVYEFNKRAIKCYEKVGFIQSGTGKTEEDIHMIHKK